jgi:4,5-DOPA dioxygenase extradiol
MTGYRFPTLFLSHGTPMLAYGEDPFTDTLSNLARSLPRPKAVVCLSAHSVSKDKIQVLRTDRNRIAHDFGGFPPDLYEMDYPTPGEPSLADGIVHLLRSAGLPADADPSGPLDHGIWIPLKALYPDGDIPVVRISLPLGMKPLEIMKMGQALAPLREQGILLLASGGAVHNLTELRWSGKRGEPEAFAVRFEEWLIGALARKDVVSLVAFEDHPDFVRSHPSTEHFLPLLFTVGSALPKDEFQIVHRGIEYATLSMLSFLLNPVPDEVARTLH